MTKSVKITIAVLLLACVIIAAFPLLSVKNSEFGGADGAAEEAILQSTRTMSPGPRVFWSRRAARRKACCSVCRPRWVPACCALGSATW